MSESPIFIVGCPRSGTALIRNLLRSHPRLTFPSESHFISKFYRAYGNPSSEGEAITLAKRILSLEWIRAWNVPLLAEEFAPDRSFADVLGRLYGAWTIKEGKPRWGDKTPHHVMDIPALVEIFPACAVVHIIRDGRDVALSWLKAGFEPRNLYMAAALWKHYVDAGRVAGANLGPDTYFEIGYESLLRDPEATMRKVCAFVGESFTSDVLCPNGPGPDRQFGGDEIITDNSAKWKSEMSAPNRELFESVAGDLLQTLGYEIEGRRRPVSTVERLCWETHHSFWWAAHRLRFKRRWGWLATDWQMRRARWLARRRHHGKTEGEVDRVCGTDLPSSSTG